MHLNLLSHITGEPWAVLDAPLADLYRNLRGVQEGRVSVNVPQISSRAEIVGPLDWNGDPVIPQIEVVNGIAVIRVAGVLSLDVGWIDAFFGAFDYLWLQQFVAQALADGGVRALMIDWKSPGGSHVGMEETAAVLAAARAQKPLFGWSGSLCASAAIRLAVEGDALYAAPSAMLGSIGSKLAFADDTRAWEMAGYKLELFTSNGQGGPSPLKGMMMSGKPVTDPERAFLIERTNECAAQFRAAVLARRPQAGGVSFDGGWVFGAQAVKDGLIDSTALSLEAVLAAFHGHV